MSASLTGHQGPFAQATGVGRPGACLLAVHAGEQLFEAAGEQDLLQPRIGARLLDFQFGDVRMSHMPLRQSCARL